MSLLKKLASETAIYGLSSIVGRLLNYLLVPMYTRVFLQSEYGVVTELYAWVGVLMVVFTYRMETGFFRFGTETTGRENAFSTIMWTLLISTPLLFGLLTFNAQHLANWLEYPMHPEYVIWFALILGLDTLSVVPFARLRLENKPWQFATIKFANIGLNIGLNLFFLLLCPFMIKNGYTAFEKVYNPQVGVGYVFIANLVASALTLAMLFPMFLKIKWTYDRALMRTIAIYAAPLILVGFASMVNELFDRTMLKWYLPGTTEENLGQLGIYSAVYKLAMLMSLFTQAFNYAAEPFFFSNANKKDSQTIYAQVTKLFTMISCVAVLGILLYLDVVKHFIGGNFRDGLHVVPILLMANLFLGLYYNFSIWYKLKDKTLIGAYIAIGGALITIILNLLWIPTLGYTGSAWATLICYAFMAAAAYVIGQKYYPVPYEIPRILGFIALALVAYGISLPIRNYFGDGTLMVYLFNTVLMIGFLVASYWLEKDWIRSVLRR
jgi:O-antigen/teichoic acid export membrane protein